MDELILDDDRLLPAEPAVRAIARELYRQIKDLPIVSMHGHVPVALLAEDQPFPDPAALFVTPDHYVTRMLVSQGAPLEELGLRPLDGGGGEADARAIWRRFCAAWPLFRGTPSRLWLEHELREVLEVRLRPSEETADALYDHIAERLERPEYRPRALFDRFGIEILATTDGALEDLAGHAAVRDGDWPGVVVPTMRPDALLDPSRPDWLPQLAALGELTGCDTDGYAGYLEALAVRRRQFAAFGALATDHGVERLDTTPLPAEDAAALFARALRGRLAGCEARAFEAHMLFEMARMATEDGLVLQLHPGVLRDHDRVVAGRFGADRGFDIPLATDFVRGLRPMLEAFGRHPRFRCVVYTVDESTWSRELAPLAGVYPGLRLGSPWWFLDAPQAMRRFRQVVTETAGFYNTAGFVDDTRAFMSIPARHDVARRVDAGYLAELVAARMLPMDEAVQTAADLTVTIPRTAFAPLKETL